MDLKLEQVRLLEKQSKGKELFDLLLNLWRENRNDENNVQKTAQFLIELNHSAGIDFCNLASIAIDEGFNVFEVMHILEDVIPRLNLHVNTFLELFEKLYEGTKNDYASHLQYKSIEKLVIEQPDFSRKLLGELIKIDRPFVVGYISTLFHSFSKNNEHAIHGELDSLKYHESSHVINAVVNALGSLDYKSDKNQPLIKKTFDIFNVFEERNMEEIDSCVTNAYGRFLKTNPEARDKLFHYVKKNKPSIDYSISNILVQNFEEYGDEVWFEDLLMELVRTKTNHKGIIDNIDGVLSNFIKKNGKWSVVERFFIRWLETSDYKVREGKLAELFNSTFAAFTEDRDNLKKLITKLFNHDSHKAHNAASELIGFCNSHKIAPLELDKAELSKLNFRDLLYIVRKVLGYVIDHQTQSSLTFSLLRKSPDNKEIQELVNSIFVNHIGQNYPASTIKFLEKQIANSKSKIKTKLAKSAIAKIKEDQKERQDLQNIKEIIPSSQPTKKILIEQSKVMKVAMEEAQKGSIMAQLCTKVILKHGSGSFSYIGGNYSPISKLTSFSASFELPSSEKSHPVHAAIERAGFRIAKRGDL